MTATTLPDELLAGYRLVRRLGSGSRSQVYLGRGRDRTVALKVFASDVSRESVGAELDALGRHESPHLVRLLDIASDAEGIPILVLERLSRGSVATLLGERDDLECGEAVTILAPLAALVGELASAGVAHRRLGPESVHLGAEGQPVVLGLGHCELFERDGTMAALDVQPGALADREALAKMASAVLGRVRDAGAPRVTDLARWIEETPKACEFPGELSERLFAVAEPLPISASMPPSGRLGRSLASGVLPRIRVADASPQVRTGSAVRGWMPGWAGELITEGPDAVKRRALDFARSVRPRFWVIAGGAALALILAISLVPGGTKAEVAPVATPSRSTVPSELPIPGASALPADPLLAAAVLLRARETCLRDLSILCLDGVDEDSAGAFQSDSTLIQKIEDGADVPKPISPQNAGLTLVERLGDSALIRLGTAASEPSILVIRTTSGWRIRDYLTGPTSSGIPTNSGTPTG